MDLEQAREKAWEANNENAHIYYENGFKHGFDDGWQARGEAWVAVSDRLPDRPGIYYVTVYDGSVRTSAFYVGSFDQSAIAWMPLPEPFNPVPTTE